MERTRTEWQNPYLAAMQRFESAYFQAALNLAYAQELVESARANVYAAEEMRKAAATTEELFRSMACDPPLWPVAVDRACPRKSGAQMG